MGRSHTRTQPPTQLGQPWLPVLIANHPVSDATRDNGEDDEERQLDQPAAGEE